MTYDSLQTLRWQRLRATLVCQRVSPALRAHALAVVQAIVKGVCLRVSGGKWPADGEPGVFFHLPQRRHTVPLREGEALPLEVLFCNRAADYTEAWRAALADYLADPATGRNVGLADVGAVEERTLADLEAETSDWPVEGEICLDFRTPFPFTPDKGKDRSFLGRNKFIQLLDSRLSRLFGETLAYRSEADDFELLPWFWNYTEIRHPSRSQPGQVQFINGCAGKLYLRGRFGDLLPWLRLASELHVGKKLSNAQGYFAVAPREQPHFLRNFPHRKAIAAATRDVLERFDNAAESLALTEPTPFSEERFAEKLCRELGDGSYAPSPATAFAIAKKDGSQRIIEQLRFRDQIVQQYLHRLLIDTFDRFFEPASIGYRKGLSRQAATDVVRQAISDDYAYVIESDIEDFFPSIDHDRLEAVLQQHLPQADAPLTRLLLTCVRTPATRDGRLAERTRGLSQGAPLSPLLANLYLDAFDEKIAALGVRMARFADDFIILTRTEEEARAVLAHSEEVLAGYGLALNRDKTAIGRVSQGFTFLGIRFDGAEAIDRAPADETAFKKPLYITEPYVFVALNGDSIDITKAKQVIASIPVRRISDIIVLEKASFSSELVKRCAEFKIPLTLTLNSGYFVATVKPDSKRYFNVAFEQGRRFAALSDTEHLCLAKEFAAGKLHNYAALFRQRGDATLTPFVHELERIAGRIGQAGDIDQVRGHEGSAAKKVYAQLNRLIDNPAFHLDKRGRMVNDPINALLNFAYYLLFTRINTTVRGLGLNPYLGFLHSHHDNYESLVCDIEELFRARVDRLVVRCINLGVIKEGDFVRKESKKGERLVLNREATARYLRQFEAELERKNKKSTLSLKEEIYVQCQKVSRHFTEDAPLDFYRWQV